MGEGIITRRGESKGILVTYLYNEGDECTALTGGWIKAGYTRGSGTLTKNTADITLYTNTSANQTVSALTTNKIDFTNFSKICFELTCTGTGGGWSKCSIQSSNSVTSTSPTSLGSIEIEVTDGIRKVFDIDISAINQSAYPNITNDTGLNDTKTIKIHKVWLE